MVMVMVMVFVHPIRKKQYIQLLKNVLDKYNLKDINININLSDHPKECVLISVE